MTKFGGRVRFVVENYGDSELAKRYGVTRYPAIFVDDVLVATPKDFGFYGKGEGEENGRYAPWREAKSHERFRSDLTRMLTDRLARRPDAVTKPSTPKPSQTAVTTVATLTPAKLPPLQLVDLDGRPIDAAALRGKVVLVEFWATWCPPCRGTLVRLGELRKRYAGRLEVVALAVDSDPADVQKIRTALDLPFHWAMSTPDLARSFGDLSAVPTMFLFDANGITREIFHGAPLDLHERLERALAAAMR